MFWHQSVSQSVSESVYQSVSQSVTNPFTNSVSVKFSIIGLLSKIWLASKYFKNGGKYPAKLWTNTFWKKWFEAGKKKIWNQKYIQDTNRISRFKKKKWEKFNILQMYKRSKLCECGLSSLKTCKLNIYRWPNLPLRKML